MPLVFVNNTPILTIGRASSGGGGGDSGTTASAAELNILDGATLSTVELNYVDGVTSAIQTQLNNRVTLTGVASVEAYGAVGDGSTDDSTAIASAFASGLSVWFSPGKTYAISAGFTLSGSGLIVYGNKATLSKTADGSHGLTVSGNENKIFNLTIDGNNYTFNGIHVTGDRNTIQGCKAVDCTEGFSAFHTTGENPGADLNSWIDCFAYSNIGVGWMLDNATDSLLLGCTSQTNGNAGLHSKNGSYSVKISGCVFDDNNHVGGAGNIILHSADATNIVNCTITNANGTAHGVYLGVATATQYGIGISGCAIAQNNGRGVLVDSGSGKVCSKIRIVNNRMNSNDAGNPPIFVGSGCTGTIIALNDLNGGGITNNGTSTIDSNNN